MNQPTKQRILELLSWSEEQYAQMQYDAGIDYLHHYLPAGNDAAIDEIVRTRTYWNWWKNHWLQRDEIFLRNTLAQLLPADRELMYLELHDAPTLARQLYPNGVVLSESYGNMIGKLTNRKVYAAERV